MRQAQRVPFADGAAPRASREAGNEGLATLLALLLMPPHEVNVERQRVHMNQRSWLVLTWNTRGSGQ